MCFFFFLQIIDHHGIILKCIVALDCRMHLYMFNTLRVYLIYVQNSVTICK